MNMLVNQSIGEVDLSLTLTLYSLCTRPSEHQIIFKDP